MRNVSDKICEENQETHLIFSNVFSENRVFYEIMWKKMVEEDRTHDDIIRCLRIALWISKALEAHSEFLILIALPRQRWLFEPASVLRLYVPCLSCWQVCLSRLNCITCVSADGKAIVLTVQGHNCECHMI